MLKKERQKPLPLRHEKRRNPRHLNFFCFFVLLLLLPLELLDFGLLWRPLQLLPAIGVGVVRRG